MPFVNGWVLFPLLELKITEYNKNNKKIKATFNPKFH